MRLKLIPHTRAARWRLALLLVLLAGVGFRARVDRVAHAFAFSPREGDIVFQPLPHAPLIDAIEGVTGSEWSHCGVLMKKDGAWMVAEAIGEVRWTPWMEWVIRGREARVQVYRLKEGGLEGDRAAKVHAQLGRLMGRPYDFRYAPGDDELYCSELVYLAYERGLGLALAPWERLGDLNWRPHEQFIREMETGPVPLDRKMVTPISLTRGPLVERVFP